MDEPNEVIIDDVLQERLARCEGHGSGTSSALRQVGVESRERREIGSRGSDGGVGEADYESVPSFSAAISDSMISVIKRSDSNLSILETNQAPNYKQGMIISTTQNPLPPLRVPSPPLQSRQLKHGKVFSPIPDVMSSRVRPLSVYTDLANGRKENEELEERRSQNRHSSAVMKLESFVASLSVQPQRHRRAGACRINIGKGCHSNRLLGAVGASPAPAQLSSMTSSITGSTYSCASSQVKKIPRRAPAQDIITHKLLECHPSLVSTAAARSSSVVAGNAVDGFPLRATAVYDISISGKQVRRNLISAPQLVTTCAAASGNVPKPQQRSVVAPENNSAPQPLDLSIKSNAAPLPTSAFEYITADDVTFSAGDPSGSGSGSCCSLEKLEKQFGKSSTIINQIGIGRRPAVKISSSVFQTMMRTHQGASPIAISSSLAAATTSTTAAASIAWKSSQVNQQWLPGTDTIFSPRVKSGATSTGRNDNHAPCVCGTCNREWDSQCTLAVHLRQTGHSLSTGSTSFPLLSASGRCLENTRKEGGVGLRNAGIGSCAKLVRGQDMWLNRGCAQMRRILRCIECRESFESLQELTVHMIETCHYANIVSSAAGTTSSATAGVSSKAGNRRPAQADVAVLDNDTTRRSPVTGFDHTPIVELRTHLWLTSSSSSSSASFASQDGGRIQEDSDKPNSAHNIAISFKNCVVETGRSEPVFENNKVFDGQLRGQGRDASEVRGTMVVRDGGGEELGRVGRSGASEGGIDQRPISRTSTPISATTSGSERHSVTSFSCSPATSPLISTFHPKSPVMLDTPTSSKTFIFNRLICNDSGDVFERTRKRKRSKRSHFHRDHDAILTGAKISSSRYPEDTCVSTPREELHNPTEISKKDCLEPSTNADKRPDGVDRFLFSPIRTWHKRSSSAGKDAVLIPDDGRHGDDGTPSFESTAIRVTPLGDVSTDRPLSPSPPFERKLHLTSDSGNSSGSGGGIGGGTVEGAVATTSATTSVIQAIESFIGKSFNLSSGTQVVQPQVSASLILSKLSASMTDNKIIFPCMIESPDMKNFVASTAEYNRSDFKQFYGQNDNFKNCSAASATALNLSARSAESDESASCQNSRYISLSKLPDAVEGFEARPKYSDRISCKPRNDDSKLKAGSENSVSLLAITSSSLVSSSLSAIDYLQSLANRRTKESDIHLSSVGGSSNDVYVANRLESVGDSDCTAEKVTFPPWNIGDRASKMSPESTRVVLGQISPNSYYSPSQVLDLRQQQQRQQQPQQQQREDAGRATSQLNSASRMHMSTELLAPNALTPCATTEKCEHSNANSNLEPKTSGFLATGNRENDYDRLSVYRCRSCRRKFKSKTAYRIHRCDVGHDDIAVIVNAI